MPGANPLMDRKVVGVAFFWSGCNGCNGHLTTTVGCSVVWCSCSCTCSCSVALRSGVVVVSCSSNVM